MKTYQTFGNRPFRLMTVEEAAVRWYRYDSVPSTMDIAAARAKSGAAPWTVVSADIQTSGRGTKGRGWFSPEGGGLWVSVILPVPECLDSVADVTVLASEALVDCLAELTGLRCGIKPPNDVTAGGRKLAGILVESQSIGERATVMVLGMGLNLRGSAGDFERAGLPEATSLIAETGSVPGDETILKSFLGHLMRRHFAAHGPDGSPPHSGTRP